MSPEFNFGKPRVDGFPIDPNATNFSELTMSLAMAGWTVSTGFATEGTVDVVMHDMGGAGDMNTEKLIEELGLRDEQGKMTDGYSVSKKDGTVELAFKGKPDEKFANVAQRLFDLSPFNN
ncbi:MAG: hypothetical protein AAB971_02330 [Patescibacteria group bacterium]